MISPRSRTILNRARIAVVLEAYRKELVVSELSRDYAKPVNLSGGQVQLGEMDEWLQEHTARQSQRSDLTLILSIVSICIALASLAVAVVAPHRVTEVAGSLPLLRIAAVWILGMLLSCVLGHFIVGEFLRRLSINLGLLESRNPDSIAAKTPSWVTGYLERFFFTVAVAADMAGVIPAMMTWLVVKLAANWQLREDIKDQREKANYKFSALLAGLVSMIIAFVLGLLIRLLR